MKIELHDPSVQRPSSSAPGSARAETNPTRALVRGVIRTESHRFKSQGTSVLANLADTVASSDHSGAAVMTPPNPHVSTALLSIVLCLCPRILLPPPPSFSTGRSRRRTQISGYGRVRIRPGPLRLLPRKTIKMRGNSRQRLCLPLIRHASRNDIDARPPCSATHHPINYPLLSPRLHDGTLRVSGDFSDAFHLHPRLRSTPGSTGRES